MGLDCQPQRERVDNKAYIPLKLHVSRKAHIKAMVLGLEAANAVLLKGCPSIL